MENKELKALLDKAASTIEALTTKKASLEAESAGKDAIISTQQEKIATYERKERCEKIASTMIDKGLLSPSDFQAEVKKMAAGKDNLDVLAKAAEMMTVKEAGISFVGDDDDTIGKTADEIALRRFNTMSK